jgi:hypothetical protein
MVTAAAASEPFKSWRRLIFDAKLVIFGPPVDFG